MYEDVKEKIKEFPDSPGVYIMKDIRGTVIYVGKALSLRKRVRSYFSGVKDKKTEVLTSRVGRVEYIQTKNEYEALLLENNLIKKWAPRYNVNLKDGKSYPVIRITNEDFPRIFRTRTIVKDGSEYYGPYTDVQSIDLYLEAIDKLLPLRKCKGRLKLRDKPCLYYHIGRCRAPCRGKISRDEYGLLVEEARRMLAGKNKDLAKRVEVAMHQAALKRDYEKAAVYRDMLQSFQTILDRQEVEDFIQESRDYIAWARDEQLGTFVVFQMRDGKLIGRDLFRVEAYGDDNDMALEFFLGYYNGQDDSNQGEGKKRDIPQVMYLSGEIETELAQEYLSEKCNRKVAVHVPKQGKHYRIMRMALDTAISDVNKRVRQQGNMAALDELREVFGLKKGPKRIEGFDISHIEGKFPVASLVSFSNGVPDKKEYRRFHIKSLGGAIDDYESIREVIARRYAKLKNEKLPLPDLILVDGGKGQVNAAANILEVLGLGHITVLGLAKREEEIHRPGSGGPVSLPDTNPALRLLQAVRDETHRFANSFNKKLYAKESTRSLLDAVPGIGPKRRIKLLQVFGSLEALGKADPEEISGQCGIPEVLAERVRDHVADHLSASEKNEKKFDISPG